MSCRYFSSEIGGALHETVRAFRNVGQKKSHKIPTHSNQRESALDSVKILKFIMSGRAAFLGTPFAYFLEWRQAAMRSWRHRPTRRAVGFCGAAFTGEIPKYGPATGVGNRRSHLNDFRAELM